MSTRIVVLVYAAKIDTEDAKAWLKERFNLSDDWSPGQLSNHAVVTLETIPQDDIPDGVMAAGIIAKHFPDIVETLKEHLD